MNSSLRLPVGIRFGGNTVLFLVVLFIGLPSVTRGAEFYPEQPLTIYEQEYQNGIELMQASRGKEAEVIFRDLVSCLRELPDPDEHLLLKTRVGIAISLERQRDLESAQDSLLRLLDVANARAAHNVTAQILIRLALIYEQSELGAICEDYLKRAERHIKQHGLREERPQLAVRWSSYHRFYGHHDSARHYAGLAAALGDELDQPTHAADGYMLSGVMSNEVAQRLEAFEKASVRYALAEDFNGSATILINLTRIALGQGDYVQSLAYTKEGLRLLDLVEDGDTRELYFRAELLKQRSVAFQSMGQMDSTVYYQSLSSDVKLRINEKFSERRILELEKRFETEKKNAKIAEQKAALELERQWRIMLTACLLILAGLGALLLLFYRRLQQSKREVDRLAASALKTNVSLEASLKEQIILQGELHHRVKNNLQIIISLLEMQSDDIQDAQARERLHIMGERIHSMAAIHEILYTREGVSKASFPEYVHRLCRHFMQLSSPADSPRFYFDLEQVWFDLETLMPLGIILNELLTNTRKYANAYEAETQIHIALTSQNGVFTLNYRDNGPGFPNGQIESRAGGLGVYLLDSMSRQLGASVKTYNDHGATIELKFRALRQSGNTTSPGLGHHSEHITYHSEHRTNVV